MCSVVECLLIFVFQWTNIKNGRMGVKAQDETEVGNVRTCERASRINRTDSTVISVRDEKSVRVEKKVELIHSQITLSCYIE